MSLVPYQPLASGFLTGKFSRDSTPAGTLERSIRFGTLAPNAHDHDAVQRWRRFAVDRGHTIGELAIAWLLASPAVASVIAGSTSAEQVEANAAAADWALTMDDLEELG
jgi:aryl-alcohol dehydrogenase-like predicted oxidoreductase